MKPDEAQLRVEFETLAKRAGLVIPEERRQAFFEAFRDFRGVLERLHRPREAAIEVASVFSVEGVRRGEG